MPQGRSWNPLGALLGPSWGLGGLQEGFQRFPKKGPDRGPREPRGGDITNASSYIRYRGLLGTLLEPSWGPFAASGGYGAGLQRATSGPRDWPNGGPRPQG